MSSGDKKNGGGMTGREESAEVISFEDASHPHVHVRKDEKLKKVQAAFKAVTREKLKSDRIEKRKKKKSRKKKKKR